MYGSRESGCCGHQMGAALGERCGSLLSGNHFLMAYSTDPLCSPHVMLVVVILVYCEDAAMQFCDLSCHYVDIGFC